MSIKPILFAASWLAYIGGLFGGLLLFAMTGWSWSGFSEIGGWAGCILWGVIWALKEYHDGGLKK